MEESKIEQYVGNVESDEDHAPAQEEKAPAHARIVVDDGTEVVTVENCLGKVLGRFVFRPADMGIVDRWNAMAKNFDRIVEPLAALGDGEPDTEAGFAALAEAKDRLCAALDAAFDGNVSEAFFAGVHPFAMVGGRFYCENVMDVVADYMSRRFNEQFKRINARRNPKVAGYAANVRTGHHAGGRK